ncbi:bumetanide-sensitive sodium-(potassium)-chloride cotransporter-like isoform X2 [Adelges cooleyi]|uniref:bumetanide-sensitive sodium-(potassium)-chloride cotransporter-like isoform X2 n=1 Tax=Adelges cooleyi TaxID=133065 RepID=UPI00217FD17F|nr:bumetanide-sensitive sodium-(potassium)-chloride cotransporter-like isoform X2 [Adelges cooleyi]
MEVLSFSELVREKEGTGGHNGVKLGWIEGVLNPCILSMWGVMLFLQLPWIVGQAGIRDFIGIILISLIIIVITTFSLSAISTNGRIKGGGLYFLISRSIGPELGASLGILFALANTILAALNTFGFCLSLKSLLMLYDVRLLDSEYAVISVGIATIAIMGIICCMGMDDEAKVQNLLIAFVVAAIVDVVLGSALGPRDDRARASGFTGFNSNTYAENWHSDYRPVDNVQQTFFTIFAIYFPSVAGIQAGANISGDLQDPGASIPKGTLWSIFIAITSYVALTVVTGSVHLREASGIVGELQDGSYLNCSSRHCEHGLYNDDKLMQSISVWPIIIYFGCFAATISSALTALIAVPKILQKMGQDKVYPFLKYLTKGYGKTNEPYRAHCLSVIIASTFIVIGDLNVLASFSTNIYLCTYALLNICTFHVAYYKPLGWRPSYKFYNKWLSLFGAMTCFVVMIYIDIATFVIIVCSMFILYAIAGRKKYDHNWGSSMQYRQYKNVLNNMYRINSYCYHVKNYTPNVLVLCGNPKARKNLVSLAHLLTKDNGLLVCMNVKKDHLAPEQRQTILDTGIGRFKKKGIKCLYNVLDQIDLDTAVRMMYLCGHGQLKPNIVLFGYKSDWMSCPEPQLQTYFNILNVAKNNQIASIIVRLSPAKENVHEISMSKNYVQQQKDYETCQTDSLLEISSETKNTDAKGTDCSVRIIENKGFSFKTKKYEGVVDVWWLYDDGGLALVIAHMLKKSTAWKNCKFRIFGVTKAEENISTERNKLIRLLSMYRIDFDIVEILLVNHVNSKTMERLTPVLNHSLRKVAGRQCSEQINNNKNRDTFVRSLFLRDLIELNSKQSSLAIVSMAKPLGDFNKIHMCVLDTITKGLTSCIIIIGNTIQAITAEA